MLYNQYPYKSTIPPGATKFKIVFHNTVLSELPVVSSVSLDIGGTIPIYNSLGYKSNIYIDEKTLLSRKLMAEDKITCQVTVSSVLNLSIGDYIPFQGSNYYINRYPSITKISDVEYQYNIVFEGEIYSLLDKLFIDLGQSEFYLYGDLDYFVGLICAQTGFTKTNIKTTIAKSVYFTGISCREVLSKLALEFDAEYLVNGKVISFPVKVEQPTLLIFKHGVNSGLYSLTRESIDDGNTVTRAYVFGSTRNITFNYPTGRAHSPRLLMPYADAPNGYIQDLTHYPKIVEKNVTFEDIYPHFTGTISAVSDDYLSVTCLGVDFNLTDYFINGVFAKIVFTSGQLLGNSFDVPGTGYNALTKTITFNKINQTDGKSLPGPLWKPVIGDTFTLIDISMPQTYITNSEIELLASGRDWLNYYSQLRIVYKLQLDPRYLRSNSILLHIGDIVTVIDEATNTNVQLRVNSLSVCVKYPERVTAELSNYSDETYERKVSTQINDTLAKINEIKSENAVVTGVSKHLTYNADLNRLEVDCSLHINGYVSSTDEITSFSTAITEILNTYGTIPPGFTPVKIGQEYIDTAAKKVYKATGISSSADWTILN